MEIETVTIPELDDVVLSLNTYLAGSNNNGKMGRFTANELSVFLAPYISAIGASGFVPTTSSVLPAAGVGKYTIVGQGTFTQTTGGNIVTSQLLNILASTATTWSIAQAIDISSGVTIGTNKTSGSSINIVDRSLVVSGIWRVRDGALSADASLNWIKYPSVPVIPGQVYKMSKTSLAVSAEYLVIFTNQSGALVSFIAPSGNNNQSFTIPAGAKVMHPNIASGINIGVDPTSSDVAKSFLIEISEGLEVVKTINSRLIEASVLSKDIEFTGAINKPQSPVTLAYLESNLNKGGNLLLGDYGFPSDANGIDTDKYLDFNTGRMYIKSGGSWGTGVFFYGSDTPFEYPAGWGSFRPLSFIKQSNGYYIPNIIDIDTFVMSYKKSLTKYYVDPVLGLDTNTGLSETLPVKTITRALALGARCICLLPGFYGRATQMPYHVDTSTSNQPMLIYAKIPGTVAFGSSDPASSFTWVADGSAYTTTRSAVVKVLDTKTRNSEGFYTRYSKKETVAEVKATPGSYCYTSIDAIYVHTLDAARPDGSIQLCFATNSSRYECGASCPFFYMSDVEFYNVNASNQMMIRNSAAQQFTTKVYTKNLRFSGNDLGNGLAIDNMLEAWTQNCGGVDALREIGRAHV